MAEQLLTSSIAAPGFMGINTQDSSVSLENGFATVAHNCIIDKFGRVGTRKGWVPAHASNTDLNTAHIKAIGELIDQDGTSYIICAGNNSLFKLVGSTLTKLTYGGGGTAPTITADHWQMAPLNRCLYLYQENHDPLVFDPAVSTTSFKRISEKAGYLGTVQQSSCVISAYGRTWSAAPATNKSLIQFSDLEAGQVLNTGTAGTLDVTSVWPNGADEIIALAAHNHTLIVFGRRQILLYKNPEDPSAMSLQDTVTGIGCCARDSVAIMGTDVFFLSDSGVRSFARTIQEKSAPMRDISGNIRDDLVNDLASETFKDIKAVYSDTNAFYLLSFPNVGTLYCFDTRKPLQDGTARVTTWDFTPKALFSTRSKDLLLGVAGYVGKYSGSNDNGSSFRWKYYTNYFDLGSPNQIKVLKKVGFTIVGGNEADIVVKYGFDYSSNYSSEAISLGSVPTYEYGVAEYGVAEYTTGIVFDNQRINIGGAGNVIQLGLESVINSFELSVQKLDVYCKQGRTN